MTWQQLGFEVGLEYTGETVKKALRSMNYRKCVACKKGWVNEKTARDRKAWAEMMKAKYPRPEGWYRMRFSDEVHFGYGPQAKLRIIRKPRERYCPDCKNVIIAGPEQVIISGWRYTLMMCRETQMGK